MKRNQGWDILEVTSLQLLCGFHVCDSYDNSDICIKFGAPGKQSFLGEDQHLELDVYPPNSLCLKEEVTMPWLSKNGELNDLHTENTGKNQMNEESISDNATLM